MTGNIFILIKQKIVSLKIVYIVSFMVIILWVLLAPIYNYDFSYLGSIKYGPTLLRGQIDHADIAQDILGFRAIVTGTDPYQILKEAAPKLGISWNADFSSVHPPTAFLFFAPIAFLPWQISSAIWGWLMFFGIYASLRVIGISRVLASIITAASLFWPPAYFSLGQLTPVWLFGVALAFRYRNIDPLKAGIWIGFASLTKLFPALLILLFIINKKWKALIGFLIVWLSALVILLLLSPDIIHRYLQVNKINLPYIFSWPHNGGWFAVTANAFGLPGLIVLTSLLVITLVLYRRVFTTQNGIGEDSWNLVSFLTVGLLPIAWTYSLLPLLPSLIFRRDPFLLAAILIPIFVGPSTHASPLAAPGSTFLVFSLILMSWLYRYIRLPIIRAIHPNNQLENQE